MSTELDIFLKGNQNPPSKGALYRGGGEEGTLVSSRGHSRQIWQLAASMASGRIHTISGVAFAHTVFGFCFLYLLNTELNNCMYKSIKPTSGKSKDMITRAPLPPLPRQQWLEPRDLGEAWLPCCHLYPLTCPPQRIVSCMIPSVSL